MIATCGLCREMIDGGAAPALHAAPAEFEWRQLGNAAQRHFAKRHPEALAAVQILTAIWVHYLLSLQLLFTDERAIELQGQLYADLSRALEQPSPIAVVDAVPAEKFDAQTLLPEGRAA